MRGAALTLLLAGCGQAPQDLNTSGDDIPSWVSPDLCELHLAQTNGASGWDLYVARRQSEMVTMPLRGVL